MPSQLGISDKMSLARSMKKTQKSSHNDIVNSAFLRSLEKKPVLNRSEAHRFKRAIEISHRKHSDPLDSTPQSKRALQYDAIITALSDDLTAEQNRDDKEWFEPGTLARQTVKDIARAIEENLYLACHGQWSRVDRMAAMAKVESTLGAGFSEKQLHEQLALSFREDLIVAITDSGVHSLEHATVSKTTNAALEWSTANFDVGIVEEAMHRTSNLPEHQHLGQYTGGLRSLYFFRQGDDLIAQRQLPYGIFDLSDESTGEPRGVLLLCRTASFALTQGKLTDESYKIVELKLD
jgi:hypothetical protein